MTQSVSVVVGGGIAGMLSAWLLAKRGDRVILIEREAETGGLLRSFDYGEWGRFDYGAHNVGQTDIPEVDALFYDLLPPDGWQVLEGNRRDLAGSFFNGCLGTGSVYPDLRSLPRTLYDKAVEDFLQNADSNILASENNAGSYLLSRFGKTVGEDILGPVVRKLFGRTPDELDIFATMLTSLDRVVMFDDEETQSLYSSPEMRERLAVPEQRTLPDNLSSGRRALYPKRYGMHRVIDSFRRKLEQSGVDIRCGAAIAKVEIEKSRVGKLRLSEVGDEKTISISGEFVWTIGLIPLTFLLGRSPSSVGDRPPRTVIVNFLLSKPLTCDLYYFYCYDQGFQTFRVTNYSAFCDGAVRAGGYPVCVEILVDSAVDVDADQIVARAKSELFSFGVTEADTHVLFARAEILAAGFPMPSLINVQAAEDARQWIASLALTNVRTVGILSKPRLFFQKDILKEVVATVGGLQ